MVTVSCAHCGGHLSGALSSTDLSSWRRWATALAEENPYGTRRAMPLVPFGSVMEFSGPDEVRWGPNSILEHKAFGEAAPATVLFFAPYELDLRLGEYVSECCGPSAYGRLWNGHLPEENLFCRCGAAIGWLEETCGRHVNFTRVPHSRITLTPATANWPPVLAGAAFDPELLRIARYSKLPDMSAAWSLWESLQLLGQACSYPCGPDHFWTGLNYETELPLDGIRVYESPFPEDEGEIEFLTPLHTTDVRTWGTHLRLAAAIEMGTFPAPPGE